MTEGHISTGENQETLRSEQTEQLLRRQQMLQDEAQRVLKEKLEALETKKMPRECVFSGYISSSQKEVCPKAQQRTGYFGRNVPLFISTLCHILPEGEHYFSQHEIGYHHCSL